MIWFTCLVVLLLLVTGCSSNSNDSSNNQPGNSSSADGNGQSGSNDVADPPLELNEREFDMGGRTIKVVSWWNMEIPEDNPDNIKRKENLEALMKKHNFNVEYIAIDFGEYKDKVVASIMSGEPIGDIVRMGRKYMIPALSKLDMFWPMDEYTRNERVFNQLVKNDFSQYEGKAYGFSEGGNMATGIYYNRTLMRTLGIKELQDYVHEDNWNWDTFIDVAKMANRDTNNDGKLDNWGLAAGGFLDQAMAANETDLFKDDKQNLEDPKTIQAFNFIARIATENVARASEGGDWTEPAQFFRQGNTLMYAGADYEAGGIKNDMPDYDIGFLPFPKGPSASVYHATEPDVQFLTIPKSVKNPDQLLYIWEKIFDIDSIYDYKGQAGYESRFSTEDDISNARVAADNMGIVANNTFPSLPYWELRGELMNGISVSTVIETYKAAVQSAIDEVYHN